MTEKEIQQEIDIAINSTRSPRVKRVLEYLLRENHKLETSRNEYRAEVHNLINENKRMRCCHNCKHFKKFEGYSDGAIYACELNGCNSLSLWEFAE